jgi:hypothetical protein
MLRHGFIRHGGEFVLRSRKRFVPPFFIFDLGKDHLCHSVLTLGRKRRNSIKRFLEQISHAVSFPGRYRSKITPTEGRVNALSF